MSHPRLMCASFTAVAFLVAGCQVTPEEAPRAGVGDPAVFTMLHIVAAEESAIASPSATTQPTIGSVREDMLRYFRSGSKDYERLRLRCDDMLDSKQAAESAAQLVSTVLDISAKISLAKVPTTQATKDSDTDSGTSSQAGKSVGAKAQDDATTKPATPTGPVLTNEDKAALAAALTATVEDSAFDRIDRAFDFFNQLHLKLLTQSFGHDSRTMQPSELWKVVQHQKIIARQRLIELSAARARNLSAEIAPLVAQRPDLADRVKKAQEALDTATRQVASSGGSVIGPGRIAAAGSMDRTPELRADLSNAQAAVADLEHRVADLTQRAEEFKNAVTRTQVELDAIQSAAEWPKDQVKDRLLFVAFPISVTPGTIANHMCGVRIRIVEGAEAVRVISLVPQRTYDLQSEVSIDLTQRIVDLALTAAFGGPGKSGDVSVKSRDERRTERRRNFLSRMSKQGAVVDSANAEFGWNFFPTNLQVNDVSALDWLKNTFTGRPNDFTINGYVDGGVYNCGAYIVVPSDLKSFSYTCEYVYARVDQDGNGGPERRRAMMGDRSFPVTTSPQKPVQLVPRTVKLPDATAWELAAGYKDVGEE